MVSAFHINRHIQVYEVQLVRRNELSNPVETCLHFPIFHACCTMAM